MFRRCARCARHEGIAQTAGAYYTPDAVVANLVRWAVRKNRDRLLDPSCGDGRFIAAHRNGLGVEQDAAAVAMGRAPGPASTRAISSPGPHGPASASNAPRAILPSFATRPSRGDVRERALQLCARPGAKFSGLTGSWAPFLVATASLLKPGGRMAFVVPAAIGHAPYAAPLLDYLVGTSTTCGSWPCARSCFPNSPRTAGCSMPAASAAGPRRDSGAGPRSSASDRGGSSEVLALSGNCCTSDIALP